MRVLPYLIIASAIACIHGAPNEQANERKLRNTNPQKQSISLSENSDSSESSNESFSDTGSDESLWSINTKKAAKSAAKKDLSKSSSSSSASSSNSSDKKTSGSSESGDSKSDSYASRRNSNESGEDENSRGKDESIESSEDETNSSSRERRKSSTSKSSNDDNNSKSTEKSKESSESDELKNSSKAFGWKSTTPLRSKKSNRNSKNSETKSSTQLKPKLNSSNSSSSKSSDSNSTEDLEESSESSESEESNTSKDSASKSSTTSSSKESEAKSRSNSQSARLSADSKSDSRSKSQSSASSGINNSEQSRESTESSQSDESDETSKESREFWELWKRINRDNRNRKRNKLNEKRNDKSRDSKETSEEFDRNKKFGKKPGKLWNNKLLNNVGQSSKQSSENSVKTTDIGKKINELNSWKNSAELSLMHLIIKINGYALKLQNINQDSGNWFYKGCEERQFIIENATANLNKHVSDATTNWTNAIAKCTIDLRQSAFQLQANIKNLGRDVSSSTNHQPSDIGRIIRSLHNQVALTVQKLIIQLWKIFRENGKPNVSISGSKTVLSAQSSSSTDINADSSSSSNSVTQNNEQVSSNSYAQNDVQISSNSYAQNDVQISSNSDTQNDAQSSSNSDTQNGVQTSSHSVAQSSSNSGTEINIYGSPHASSSSASNSQTGSDAASKQLGSETKSYGESDVNRSSNSYAQSPSGSRLESSLTRGPYASLGSTSTSKSGSVVKATTPTTNELHASTFSVPLTSKLESHVLSAAQKPQGYVAQSSSPLGAQSSVQSSSHASSDSATNSQSVSTPSVYDGAHTSSVSTTYSGSAIDSLSGFVGKSNVHDNSPTFSPSSEPSISQLKYYTQNSAQKPQGLVAQSASPLEPQSNVHSSLRPSPDSATDLQVRSETITDTRNGWQVPTASIGQSSSDTKPPIQNGSPVPTASRSEAVQSGSETIPYLTSEALQPSNSVTILQTDSGVESSIPNGIQASPSSSVPSVSELKPYLQSRAHIPRHSLAQIPSDLEDKSSIRSDLPSSSIPNSQAGLDTTSNVHNGWHKSTATAAQSGSEKKLYAQGDASLSADSIANLHNSSVTESRIQNGLQNSASSSVSATRELELYTQSVAQTPSDFVAQSSLPLGTQYTVYNDSHASSDYATNLQFGSAAKTNVYNGQQMPSTSSVLSVSELEFYSPNGTQVPSDPVVQWSSSVGPESNINSDILTSATNTQADSETIASTHDGWPASSASDALLGLKSNSNTEGVKSSVLVTNLQSNSTPKSSIPNVSTALPTSPIPTIPELKSYTQNGALIPQASTAQSSSGSETQSSIYTSTQAQSMVPAQSQWIISSRKPSDVPVSVIPNIHNGSQSSPNTTIQSDTESNLNTQSDSLNASNLSSLPESGSILRSNWQSKSDALPASSAQTESYAVTKPGRSTNFAPSFVTPSQVEPHLTPRSQPKPDSIAVPNWPTDVRFSSSPSPQLSINSNSVPDRQDTSGYSANLFPQTQSGPIKNSGWQTILNSGATSMIQDQTPSLIGSESSIISSSQPLFDLTTNPDWYIPSGLTVDSFPHVKSNLPSISSRKTSSDFLPISDAQTGATAFTDSSWKAVPDSLAISTSQTQTIASFNAAGQSDNDYSSPSTLVVLPLESSSAKKSGWTSTQQNERQIASDPSSIGQSTGTINSWTTLTTPQVTSIVKLTSHRKDIGSSSTGSTSSSNDEKSTNVLLSSSDGISYSRNNSDSPLPPGKPLIAKVSISIGSQSNVIKNNSTSVSIERNKSTISPRTSSIPARLPIQCSAT